MIWGTYCSPITLQVIDSRDDWFVISFRPCNFPGELPAIVDETEALKQLRQGQFIHNVNMKGKKEYVCWDFYNYFQSRRSDWPVHFAQSCWSWSMWHDLQSSSQNNEYACCNQEAFERQVF
jgi:hypothetical protein